MISRGNICRSGYRGQGKIVANNEHVVLILNYFCNHFSIKMNKTHLFQCDDGAGRHQSWNGKETHSQLCCSHIFPLLKTNISAVFFFRIQSNSHRPGTAFQKSLFDINHHKCCHYRVLPLRVFHVHTNCQIIQILF